MYAIRSYYDLYKERQSPEEGKDYRIKILRDYATLVNPANEIPLSEFTSRHNKATQAVGYGKGAMVFHIRITSYNVCYTKLLRSVCCKSSLALVMEMPGRVVGMYSRSPSRNNFV